MSLILKFGKIEKNVAAYIKKFKDNIIKKVNRNVAVILTYHSVDTCYFPFDIWHHIKYEIFEKQIETIKQNANPVSIIEIFKGIKNGIIPKYAVGLTFDDGFQNNYSVAFPILKHYNFPATIFLTTDFIGNNSLLHPEYIAYLILKNNSVKINKSNFKNRNKDNNLRALYKNNLALLNTMYNEERINFLSKIEKDLEVSVDENDELYDCWKPLNWKEVNEMNSSSLIEFGAHTCSHPDLNSIPNQIAEKEIKNSIETIKSKLGKCRLFAIPYGGNKNFSKWHIDTILKYGCCSILSDTPEYITIKSKPYLMGRFDIGGKSNTKHLHEIAIKRYYFGKNR